MGLIIVGLIVVGVVAFVGGGNTLSGFGHDVENTGEKIQDAGN